MYIINFTPIKGFGDGEGKERGKQEEKGILRKILLLAIANRKN